MASGQKAWQNTTAGTFWFSSFAAGLFVVACLVAGTLDFLLFPKPSSSFVGHFHGSCHDYLACPMTEDWVLAPEVTEISPAVESVANHISPGVRICLISPADASMCIDQPVSDQPQVTSLSPASLEQYEISLPGIRMIARVLRKLRRLLRWRRIGVIFPRGKKGAL